MPFSKNQRTGNIGMLSSEVRIKNYEGIYECKREIVKENKIILNMKKLKNP